VHPSLKAADASELGDARAHRSGAHDPDPLDAQGAAPGSTSPSQ
jgi:hypothetical protein